MRLPRLAVTAMVAVLTSGCANLPYYLQSVRGQLDIWSRQHQVEAVIDDPQTAAPLRDKLRTVLAIRDFASSELNLPRNSSYRLYANLERAYVVWNVFAAPEFSIEPRQWCFIFAGCVKYRGYFHEEDAQAFAAELATDGHDVFVGGVPAYSTLGYFPDPVLNTFVNYPTPHLARLIFHELAHQVVYVRDDSVFNESFAVAVEQEGMRRWLERYGSEQDRANSALMTQRREQFVQLIESYRGKLDALYRSGIVAHEMRARKTALFDQLGQDYRALREGWGGFAGYDRWFAQKPSNALLASVAIYTRNVPAFEALLAREGRDMGRFFTAVKVLAKLDKGQRTAALASLTSVAARAATSAH
jgi:predicted aminopeptidase